MGNMTWPEKINFQSEDFFFFALIPAGCVSELFAEAAQQELFVFNAVHPQKLMDGRVRTEALAPFIKTRQPPGAGWHK